LDDETQLFADFLRSLAILRALTRRCQKPRLNDLLRGKIDKFSLDALFDLIGRVGLKVSIALPKAA
jgi:predicted XRE-type DNA-binding protein